MSFLKNKKGICKNNLNHVTLKTFLIFPISLMATLDFILDGKQIVYLDIKQT